MSKPHILLADDHPQMLANLCRLADKAGEVVGAVTDGRAAVDASVAFIRMSSCWISSCRESAGSMRRGRSEGTCRIAGSSCAPFMQTRTPGTRRLPPVRSGSSVSSLPTGSRAGHSCSMGRRNVRESVVGTQYRTTAEEWR